MDTSPAEETQPLSNAERILAAVSSQAATMEWHEQVLAQQEVVVSKLSQAITEILQHLQSLSNTQWEAESQPHAPPVPPIPAVQSSDIHLPHPERYDGSPGRCKSFLTQCSLNFELQPNKFPTARSKMAYVITLLSGKPLPGQLPCGSRLHNQQFVWITVALLRRWGEYLIILWADVRQLAAYFSWLNVL